MPLKLTEPHQLNPSLILALIFHCHDRVSEMCACFVLEIHVYLLMKEPRRQSLLVGRLRVTLDQCNWLCIC